MLDSSSWDTILSSLGNRPIEPGRLNPPMAMPIALTPNLLHDYAPLVWAGGGRFIESNHADLTSDAALAIPRKLMERATQPGEHNSSHRILAFPEMSHEEAVQHFLNGEYLALIEPVSFIKRWKDVITKNGLPRSFSQDQQQSPGPGSINFWDYAGVAAPPRTFIGGSDLIVMRGFSDNPAERDLSFKLVRFLALDEKYSKTLVELGTLPAQQQKYGVDTLGASLKDKSTSSQGGDHDSSTEFAIALSLALSRRTEQEYPALAEWPDYVESREVLEAIQRIWRRIGEGQASNDAVASLIAAAEDAELAVNRHLDWRVKFEEDVKRWWQFIAITLISGLLAAIAIVLRELRISKEQERASSEVRKLRGFASAALQAVYEIHSILPQDNPYSHLDENERGKSEKALVLMYGLQGWRRGRDDQNWKDTELKKVIWSAFVLALESKHKPRLYRKWQQNGHLSAREFLKKEYLIRDHPEICDPCPPFYFQVDCPDQVKVPLPFMLEQALVCLLQNAITASSDSTGNFLPITVAYDAISHAVYVLNQDRGRWLCKENSALCDALNEVKDLNEFEERIDQLLLKGGNTPKPGVGLVEAFCIATQCYGGLVVDKHLPKISIRLSSS
jgi:hypothetical protein